MKKKITADKALKIFYIIDKALYIIFCIPFVIFLFLAYFYYSGESKNLLFLFTMGLGIFLFALFMSVLSPTFQMWKFWAFNRVENVHELKKRLILLGEIPENSNFFLKLENNTEYSEKYRKLHLRFSQESAFTDDRTVSDETIFYSSNKKSQLILNDKGINNTKTGFHKWEEINVGIIEGRPTYLKFGHSRGHETIIISKFKTNAIELSKLINIYVERNKLQQKEKY